MLKDDGAMTTRQVLLLASLHRSRFDELSVTVRIVRASTSSA
jgi:hypothetical protein